MCPSTGPLLQGCLSAANKAASSRRRCLGEVGERSRGRGVAPDRPSRCIPLADGAKELTRQASASGDLRRSPIKLIQVKAGFFWLLEYPPGNLPRRSARNGGDAGLWLAAASAPLQACEYASAPRACAFAAIRRRASRIWTPYTFAEGGERYASFGYTICAMHGLRSVSGIPQIAHALE